MRSVAIALLAAAACATGADAVAPAPSPFRGVRSLLLVRSVEDRGRRAKDPLDGLDESLRARGFTTRVVELGSRPPPELGPVERLFGQLATRAASGRAERTARPVTSARDAGALVDGLGVDAVASYHRVDRHRASELAAPAPPSGSMFSAPPPPAQRATGAFVLADRAGHVQTFAWGDAGPIDDPSVPLNPAEAIELLVRAVTGDPAEP
jgi:hypothetical protein